MLSCAMVRDARSSAVFQHLSLLSWRSEVRAPTLLLAQFCVYVVMVHGLAGRQTSAKGCRLIGRQLDRPHSTQDKVSQLFVIEASGKHRDNDKKL